MNIASEINRMIVPQEFSRLCKAILIAEHGDDFLSIDDDVKDKGNDGYLKSEKRLYAFNCFKRMQNQGIQADILKKMRSDLSKVPGLRERGWEIEKWTFISNYPIPEDVAAKIRMSAREFKVDVNWRDHENISADLRKNPHLYLDFPALNPASEDDSYINVLDELDGIKELVGVMNSPKNASEIGSDKEYSRVMDICREQYAPELYAELKSFVYASSSPLAAVQAVAILDKWFDPSRDSLLSMIEITSSGLMSASTNNDTDALTMMLAFKFKYQGLQIDSMMRQAMPSAGLFTDKEFERISLEIAELEESHQRTINKFIPTMKLGASTTTIALAMQQISITFHVGAKMKRDLEPETDRWVADYREAIKYANGSIQLFTKAGLTTEALSEQYNLAMIFEFGDEVDVAKSIYKKIISHKQIDETSPVAIKSHAKLVEL